MHINQTKYKICKIQCIKLPESHIIQVRWLGVQELMIENESSECYSNSVIAISEVIKIPFNLTV